MTKAKRPTRSDPKISKAVPAEMRLAPETALGGTWLDQRLKALYETVIYEPMPEEMLRLLTPRKH